MNWSDVTNIAERNFQSFGKVTTAEDLGVDPEIIRELVAGKQGELIHEYSEDAPVLPMPIENDEPEKPAIPEKSFWHSKIFWVQSVTLLAAVLGGFGLDISPEYQQIAIEVITGVMGGTSLLTILFRVFFTSTRIKAVRRR